MKQPQTASQDRLANPNSAGHQPERWQIAGFGLYVHWPFCQSKCPYCDFNSHVAAHIDQQQWLDGYLGELRRLAQETKGRVLTSIFFGGGTPSLMEPFVVGAIIDEATSLWTSANDIEITLEANPTSVEIQKFHGFRAAGVNRVSLGVQALQSQDLRRLGRMHDEKEAVQAIEISQKVFDRTSFDLIYARQDQSIGGWEVELRLALSLASDHLSLYQLTIEPGTVFGARHERGQLTGLPKDDLSADMYELTQEICAAAGFPAYEISNHASHGSESRHNMIYWKGGDYVGIGPGAHGRLTTANGERVATLCPKEPGKWLAHVKAGRGEIEREKLTTTDQVNEFLIMGLRLSEGIDLNLLQKIGGPILDEKTIMDLMDQGLLLRGDGYLRTTATGRMLLNRVINALQV